VPGAWNKLTVGGGINYQSSSHTQVPSPDGGATLLQTDVILVSLMARYQLTPSAALQFNGANLLDKKYYVLDEYGNAYYGAPANVSLGVNLKF
jgi:outer membrane receptor for ferric coprogen and ferric-rhodotorulic acid